VTLCVYPMLLPFLMVNKDFQYRFAEAVVQCDIVDIRRTAVQGQVQSRSSATEQFPGG